MVKPFELISSRHVLDSAIFRMREDKAQHPKTGAVAPYIVLETSDWVTVVPETPDGHVVMVKQWRHGSRTIELEFPAGLVDPGETPDLAGPRELQEETGFTSSSWETLGSMYPNPAFQQNRSHVLWARDVMPTSSQALDAGEDIDVVMLTRNELRDCFVSGALRNAISQVALFMWLERQNQVVWPGPTP
jgi:ADP-ribose pyrophosphatase